MQRRGVIAVDAVLGEELPVRAARVALRAADDTHLALERLVGDEVEVLLRAREVRLEIGRALVEAHEMEIAVALVPRDGLQPELRLDEPLRRVAIGLRNADEVAAGVDRPRVVEALERLRVALVAPADDRATMGAGVVEHADVLLPVTPEHQRASADP